MGRAALAVLTLVSGCYLEEVEDREDCNRALAIVCSCASVDCSTDATPIVALLRRCNHDEVYQQDDLALCIQDSPSYCAIRDSIAGATAAACEQTCRLETACDLEQSCHDYQFASCDVP